MSALREPTSAIQLLGAAPRNLVGAHAESVRSEALWSDLHADLRQLGFEHWTYCAVPACYSGEAVSMLRVTTYPTGWTEAFETNDFRSCSPPAVALRHRDPVSFGDVRDAMPRTPRFGQLLELNRSFDVSRGVIVPLRNAFGMGATLALAFAGKTRDLEAVWREHRPSLVARAQDFNRRALRCHAPLFSAGIAARLTERQREVVRLLALGRTTSESADALGISLHTVDKHIAGAKRSLGARSSAQLTALALCWGLIS